MFQFRRFPTYAYLIQRRLTEYCSAGFPHSEILGSMRMCRSPRLIAACHVLLRLLMPRHSPCALCSLTSSAWAPYPSLPGSARKLTRSAPPPLRPRNFVPSAVEGHGALTAPSPCRTALSSCSQIIENHADNHRRFNLTNCFYP